MPTRQKISAKYNGENGEYFNGIPARDLTEDEFDRLSDEQKALLAADPPEGVKRLYTLRHDAPAEAEKAATRVERAAAPSARAEAVPAAASQPAPPPPADKPAPKDEAKK